MIKKLKSCEKNATAVRNTITIIINFFKSLQSLQCGHAAIVTFDFCNFLYKEAVY